MTIKSEQIESNKISMKMFIILFFLGTLAQICADMYLPSLPALVQTFNSNVSKIQLTITVFMLGYSFSHLIYGPISDRIGRRRPILVGISLCLVACLVCFFASTVEILILGRLLQGFGVGVCTSVGRSLARDLFTGEQLAKIGSQLGIMSVLAIVIAPIIGGYIQSYATWRVTFFILSLYTAFILAYIWKNLSETNKYLNLSVNQPVEFINNFLTLLKSKVFLGHTFCSSLTYAGLIAYITSAPFLLQTVLGVTSIEFGWSLMFIAISLVIGAFINSKLVTKIGLPKMIAFGVFLMLVGSLLMLLCSFFYSLSILIIIMPIMIFSIGSGFTLTNCFVSAFHPFSKIAGSASALFGCLQILGGGLSSMLVSITKTTNQLSLAVILLVASVLAVASLSLAANNNKKIKSCG